MMRLRCWRRGLAAEMGAHGAFGHRAPAYYLLFHLIISNLIFLAGVKGSVAYMRESRPFGTQE